MRRKGVRMRAQISLLCLSLSLLGCAIPAGGPQTNPGTAPPVGPASCQTSQQWCHGSCVDSSSFLNDDQNCGRCGNSCSIGESCTGGSCSCSPGSEKCMGQCRSTASYISDSQNCGRCGNICFGTEQCIGGSCRTM